MRFFSETTHELEQSTLKFHLLLATCKVNFVKGVNFSINYLIYIYKKLLKCWLIKQNNQIISHAAWVQFTRMLCAAETSYLKLSHKNRYNFSSIQPIWKIQLLPYSEQSQQLIHVFHTTKCIKCILCQYLFITQYLTVFGLVKKQNLIVNHDTPCYVSMHKQIGTTICTSIISKDNFESFKT